MMIFCDKKVTCPCLDLQSPELSFNKQNEKLACAYVKATFSINFLYFLVLTNNFKLQLKNFVGKQLLCNTKNQVI